jgi:hypothetical protein
VASRKSAKPEPIPDESRYVRRHHRFLANAGESLQDYRYDLRSSFITGTNLHERHQGRRIPIVSSDEAGGSPARSSELEIESDEMFEARTAVGLAEAATRTRSWTFAGKSSAMDSRT